MTQLAATPRTHHTEHRIDVAAPADAAYQVIADAGSWPVVFPPNVHVEYLEQGEGTERIQIWATANGEVKTWVSRRELDPAARRIRFRQDTSQHPVASMGGEWIVEPAGAGACTLVLLHDFTAAADHPEHVEWISRAVETNSARELAGIKALAEAGEAARAALTFSFEDSVSVAGDPARVRADVFEFLDRADAWPQRLPHVSTLDLREDVPGIQLMTMDTRTADGSVHTTVSVRICFAGERIVYKQTKTPALMSAHTGEWRIEDAPGGVTVTSRHTVALRPEAIGTVLGPDATVATAREFVQRALSTNSTATLGHAKRYAEARGG